MKKILTVLFSLLLLICMTLNIAANDNKIIDEANVLTEQDKNAINNEINKFINETNFDIVVYFTYDNEYYQSHYDPITELADDTYDYNGYGIGPDSNGLIMCVDVYQRDYTITTCGADCINTFSDQALNDMYNTITPNLANDDWANAALTFVTAARGAYASYDYYHQKPSIVETSVIPSLAFAAFVTLIVFLILRGQLKHTGVKREAFDYMKDQRINVFRSGDVFLYQTVSRTKVPKAEPSRNSGGSTTHISSSGRSHGGGGSHRF